MERKTLLSIVTIILDRCLNNPEGLINRSSVEADSCQAKILGNGIIILHNDYFITLRYALLS